MKKQTNNRFITRYGFVREIPKDIEKTRTVPFIISNETKDRHGTVLNMKNWNLDNYMLNPIVGYQHQVYGGFRNDPDYVIGTSNVFIEGTNLIGEVTFEPESINKLAEKILQKVIHRTLRAASVGFMPIGKGKYGEKDEAENEKNETYYYAGQELLEWSVVNIGSNPTAVKKNVLGQFADLLLNYFTRDELEKMTIDELLSYAQAAEQDVETEFIDTNQYQPGDVDERPYENEHAARLKEPGDFDENAIWNDGTKGKFRRTTTKSYLGKKSEKQFDVIWGKLKGKAGKDDAPIGQALRFKKETWTASDAKKWLDDNNITYILWEPAAAKQYSENYDDVKRKMDLYNITN